MICSRRKSKSSSQFDRLVCAVDSLEVSSSSASSMGYESITLAFRTVSVIHCPSVCIWLCSGSSSYSKPDVNFISWRDLRPRVQRVVNLERCFYRVRCILDDTSVSKIKLLQSRVVSHATFLSLRNLTVSRVFSISGIFPLRPAIRRWRFSSMN